MYITVVSFCSYASRALAEATLRASERERGLPMPFRDVASVTRNSSAAAVSLSQLYL